jgi:hypothetical protein
MVNSLKTRSDYAKLRQVKAITGRVEYSSKERKKSDKENLVLDGEVTGSQRRIVVVITCARHRRSRNNF